MYHSLIYVLFCKISSVATDLLKFYNTDQGGPVIMAHPVGHLLAPFRQQQQLNSTRWPIYWRGVFWGSVGPPAPEKFRDPYRYYGAIRSCVWPNLATSGVRLSIWQLFSDQKDFILLWETLQPENRPDKPKPKLVVVVVVIASDRDICVCVCMCVWVCVCLGVCIY